MNILDRQCEKFLGGPTVAYAERIHATINRSGTIFLNRKAHALMGSPQAVYLYFNREKDLIIIEPTPATTSQAAFTMRSSPPGHNPPVRRPDDGCHRPPLLKIR